MKKIIAFILTIITAFSLVFTVSCKKSEENKLAVAIVPLKTFLSEIVKDKFDIVVAVPNGQSPESYEPTPKEMLSLSSSKIYFSIGIINEQVTILPNLKCDKIELDKEVVKGGYNNLTFDNGARDPHIWLSIKRAIKIVEIMRDEVIKLDGENANFYTQNAKTYIQKLTNLYDELSVKFNAVEESKKVFIAYHPSFNYFANEFNLKCYAIEKDGHEATAKDLASLVTFAKENNIKKVFYQAETDSSQAISFANEIGGNAYKLSPLSSNYIENLKEMANAIILFMVENKEKIAVKVSGLSVIYSSGVNALENISFEIKEGEFLGIIGPNGGGKTTLIKAILNLIPVNAGSVEIFGKPINEAKGEIGYVPQFSEMNATFPISVKQVVLSGFLGAGRPLLRYTKAQNDKADEILKTLGIYDKKDCLVSELSGGQRQRLLIARALVSSPKILVLDEPTASVDPVSSENIFEILANLKGVTIIVVTHDMFAVSSKIRSLACLNKTLVYHGEPELTKATVESLYNCPVELIAHGVPHRVLPEHDGCSCCHSHHESGGEL